MKLALSGHYQWPIKKNYKITACIQGFDNNRKENTKYTVWKSKAVMDLQRVWSFFNENDWLKLFHKLTTDEIEKLRGQNNMQFTVQGRI